jgi:hypothetical protein
MSCFESAVAAKYKPDYRMKNLPQGDHPPNHLGDYSTGLFSLKGVVTSYTLLRYEQMLTHLLVDEFEGTVFYK